MMKRLILLAKVTLSAGLVWYAFGKIDFPRAWASLSSIPLTALLAAVALLYLQFVLGAFRLSELLREMGQRYRLTSALDAVLVGAFFSQTLISFVGGDAMRIWRMMRSRIPAHIVTKSVVLDRIAGIGSIVALVLVTIPILSPMVSSLRFQLGLLLITIAVLGGIFVVFVLRRLPAQMKKGRIAGSAFRLTSLALDIGRSARGALYVLGVSIIIQAMNVLVLFILARGLSINISLGLCFVLMPTVLFLSMLPISVAGWGVREGAMVSTLAVIGVPAHQSLALSICFGLSLVFVSLPGGLIWFVSKGKSSPAADAGPGT